MVIKVNVTFALLIFLLLIVSFANAQTVAQEIGFKEVAFASLNKQACQECHDVSLVDTHHETEKALSGDCVSCHAVSSSAGRSSVTLNRDCMVCHQETPHHKTEAAQNNECTACHDSPGLNDYSTDVVQYPISKVTPSVANCKSCHGSGEAEGIQIVSIKKTHHDIALNDCNICHEGAETKTTNIRLCERCHNEKVIHEIAAHTEAQACVKCHSPVGQD